MNKTRKTRVYIASPYSNGNKQYLVDYHLEAAYELLKLGFNPYAPLYNHYIQVKHPELDEGYDWLRNDKEWLDVCDVMVRLIVKDEDEVIITSSGADIEEEHARLHNIPVFHFYSLDEMVDYMETIDTVIDTNKIKK